MDSTRDIFKDSVPTGAIYNNLFKRPESEREFPESIMADAHRDGSVRMYGDPTMVARFKSRQLFLRSYPFTRKENSEKMIGCFSWSKVKKAVNSGGGGRKCARLRKAKKEACSALRSIFRHVGAVTALHCQNM